MSRTVSDLEISRGEEAHFLHTAVRPASDQRLTNELHNRQFGNTGRIKLGRVMYAMPYAHCYKVQMDDGGGDRVCTAASPTSLAPFSVGGAGPISPNSTVLVYTYEGQHYGIIICVVPDLVKPGDIVYPDSIEQGSNCGFAREQYYHGLMAACANDAGVLDFSNSRPLDSLAGEWGAFSDLGLGVFLDNYMAFMRVDETAGLFMYYMDRLVRLAGYNLQLETAGSEWMVRNDQGEMLNVHGSTPYPWEALGLASPTDDPHQVHDDFDVQYEKPVGKFEPADVAQQPFYRFEEFRDYLGQGYMRHVAAPNTSHTGVNKYTDRTAIPQGLFRESIGLDGSYSLSSAHSIQLVKRLLIPVPKRLCLPEDLKDGDNETNYKFAGIAGEGEEHKVTDIPDADDFDLPHLLTSASVEEITAYVCNWKTLHPFHYHKKDYLTPEEGDLPLGGETADTLDLASLKSRQWLEKPRPKSYYVDHRYGEVKFYETTAGLWITPDGSVVIRDAYGSEIRMSGGTITQSAPGDIWRQAGRSVIDWAGDDAIIKARNSVDVTSSHKDVHIKAEQNLEMLSANGGRGRMLLESKATEIVHDYEGKVGEDITDASGIILKADNCQVVTVADDVYVRSLAGGITLDANKGAGDIQTVSAMFDRKLTMEARDTFYDGDTVVAANSFTKYLATLGSPIYVDGMIANTQDGMVIRGGINVVEGHIATQQAQNNAGKVGELKGMPLSQTNDVVKAATNAEAAVIKNAKTALKTSLDDTYYADGKIGSDDMISNCQFSLRNEDQYGTAEFCLPETHWQHVAAIAGAGEPWEETAVQYQDQALMPYPGREAWEEKEDAFLRPQDKFVDPATGRSVDRADNTDYTEPKLADWTKQTLVGNYTII